MKKRISTLRVFDPARLPGTLRSIGGSNSDTWNNLIANQAITSIWNGHSDEAQTIEKNEAAVSALMAIGPRDEMEGMMAAQLIAAHNAAMECYRRAMLPEQPFEGRRENLSQANKLSRTYATLMEALNRHRGKWQQTVTVEHVHVHEGGQAIVGNGGGGGKGPKWENKPQQITHHRGKER